MNIPNEISVFFNEQEQLKAWPSKRKKKLLALDFLSTKFKDDTTYSESEVNQILERWHTFNDAPLLRREMFENGILNRTKDCLKYWCESALYFVKDERNFFKLKWTIYFPPPFQFANIFSD